MSTPTTISSIILSILLLSGVLGSAQGEDALFAGSFRYVKGEVTLESKKVKSVQNALKDMQFFEGDKITTQKNSFAILNLQDGSTVKVTPSSELTVIALIGKSEKGYFGVSRLLLGLGGVMVDVVKKFTGPPSVEIETKKGLAFGVRGTKFYTFIESDAEDTWTIVLDGEVQAFDFTHDDSEIVPAGTSIVAIEGEQLTVPQKYLWVKKISWNHDPEKGELDSGIATTFHERQSELAMVLKKILNRKRKPFINTENNPRKMKVRALRQDNESEPEENASNSVLRPEEPIPTTSTSTDTASGTTNGFSQSHLPQKIQVALQKISAKNPNAPKPIPATEQNGNIFAQATCTKVAPSGFPCIVRQGSCIGEEVSAAIFFTPATIYNVCVKIINGVFL